MMLDGSAILRYAPQPAKHCMLLQMASHRMSRFNLPTVLSCLRCTHTSRANVNNGSLSPQAKRKGHEAYQPCHVSSGHDSVALSYLQRNDVSVSQIHACAGMHTCGRAQIEYISFAMENKEYVRSRDLLNGIQKKRIPS